MALITPFDPWESKICTCPKKYSLSPYTGCSHKCLYCYISSYIPNPFNPRPKKNFLNRLTRELPRIDRNLPIVIASSSDPYIQQEEKFGLTRSTIKILRDYSTKFQLLTKSDLITRDIDLLREASVAVSFTVTTLNNDLASKLEPSAPSPTRRLNAIQKLNSSGIVCSARIDPIIPGINGNEAELKILISKLAEAGVKHITASTYKAKPDNFKRLTLSFPTHRESLQTLYWKTGRYVAGSRYLSAERRLKLITIIKQLTESYGMKFASCREGLETLNSSISCDSSYLIQRCSPNPSLNIIM